VHRREDESDPAPNLRPAPGADSAGRVVFVSGARCLSLPRNPGGAMTSQSLHLCIVGAGPRGLSVLERICANAWEEAFAVRTVVHVVDPQRPGAGNVWRRQQPGHLLMNTVSSQVTLFTDRSVELTGPAVPGPSLYEWARILHVAGKRDGYGDQVMAEAARLGPDDYPTRAFYGHYLEWVFQRVLATAPAHLEIRVHRSRAVALDDCCGKGGRQVVTLEDGTLLTRLDAVVLTQGHVAAEPTEGERAYADHARRHGLTYIPPANPADVDLSFVEPGQAVALRGLGLNFFDHMALLTAGRGGIFETGEDGRLVYRPSGREPRMYAGSRRGIPHHSRGENQKGAAGRHEPVVLTLEAVAELRERSGTEGGLDFRRDVWPLIAKETETVYYTALLAARPGADEDEVARFRERFLALPHGGAGEAALLDEAGVAAGERWDWERIALPHGDRRFTGPDDFRAWLLEYLEGDVAAALEGNVSGPLKSAADVLRDLRNEIRLVVDHGGLDGGSHRDDLDRWYTPLNAFLSIGPPARRVREMIALIEAGVLEVVGPGARVDVVPDEPYFALESPRVPGSRVRATVLLEARLPDPDLRRTGDPLMRHLLAAGQCRPFTIPDGDGGAYQTGGLDVTERPSRLVDARGQAHPRRFALGIPTEAVHWVTAAGVRPWVNSVTLTDSDAIARAVLGIRPRESAVPGRDAVMADTLDA
jgi:FAD-NAD(P)-binding